jgi:type I restriction enzyme M protein
MREIKSQDEYYVEELKGKVWSMFDELRRDISAEDFHIILFLLSLYKDGLIASDNLTENSNNQNRLIQDLYSSENILAKKYVSILPSFEPILMRLNGITYIRIIISLGKINRKVLSDNFTNIFDSFLYRIFQSQGRFGGEFILPLELTRFILGLAELKSNSKVYNPFAGLASFKVFLDQGINYFGQEMNNKTWALGALRLLAHDKFENNQYNCEDSVINWPNQSEKFDLIVSIPPFNLGHRSQFRNEESNFKNIAQFILEIGVQSLNEEGKLIAILPASILFNVGQDQRLRERLIEHDLIDQIIALPTGLLLNTGINLVVMVLNKSKKLSRKVRFIDAKNYVVKKNLRENVLCDLDLKNLILSNKFDNEEMCLVGNEQIIANDCNLNVSRYFRKEIEGVKLGDILSYIRGHRGNLSDSGKLVRIRDLKDDKVDFNLDISNIEVAELIRPDIHQISESCLLLAVRWRTLRPTLFEFSNESIYKSHDILSFKINEDIVDKAYLINELHADYVLEQLDSLRVGAAVPYIRKDDLLEIIVKLPTLNEQKAKVQGILELSDKIKILQEERNALAHGRSTKQFSEFASLKHTLGRPRQNILDWSDNLIHFLNEKSDDFDGLNRAFAEFYDINIISALKEIKRDVNFITDVLEKGENGFILNEYEKQNIPLSDINNIINDLSNNGFNFKIKKLLLKGDKLKDRGIFANRTLLKTLVDNILTNADKYGFDSKEISNEVVIELTEFEDLISLEIRNNGKVFPRNFDREKFITKYSTANTSAGSGLGGYDIHRIASDFNNPNWELILNEDPIYPVKFKFQFHIKPIN